MSGGGEMAVIAETRTEEYSVLSSNAAALLVVVAASILT